MELTELKTMWQAFDNKLERSLHLNMQVLERLGREKVTDSFQALVRVKAIGIITGILWTIFLGSLLYNYHTEPFFVVSLTAIMLFTVIAIAGYVYQVTLIRRIRFSDPILETQRKLATLQSSIIRLTRLLFLQTPFYATFFITTGMLRNGTTGTLLILFGVVAFFVLLSVWLYRNISFRNMNRNWVKALLSNEGGKSIARAIEYIREIEAFKQEQP